MQEISLDRLKNAVSYALIALDSNMRSARNDPLFIAIRSSVVSEVFQHLSNSGGQFEGYQIVDSEKAVEILRGQHGKEVAALAVIMVYAMIREGSEIPRPVMLWIGDILKGAHLCRLSETSPTILGQHLLLRHVAKVSAEKIPCHLTTENHGVLTGARLVHECLKEFNINMSMVTLNRIVATAKYDNDFNLSGIDPQPNKRAHNVLAVEPLLSEFYCATEAGLGDQFERVMATITNFKHLKIS